MSTFKDAAEVYEYLGKVFEIAVNDPQFVEATKNGDLVVRLTQTDPASTILIDFPGQKVTCGDAAEGAPSTVELRMSADNGHKFWLGKLNLTLALAQGKAKMSGSRTRSEEHTSELQSLTNLVCRLLLEKKKTNKSQSR